MFILHDYMDNTDGGSRLCLDLARQTQSLLLCGFIRKNHPFLSEMPYPQCMTHIPYIAVPLVRQWLLALAFLYKKPQQRPQVPWIFSGSYAPLAVRHTPHAMRTMLYCHTPPRFLYDQSSVFMQRTPFIARPLLHAFCAWLRPQYETAVSRMSTIVANSHAVRKRIEKYLGYTAQVVYPPCQVEKYTWQPSQGYYLSMTRLDALKRVEICIDAFLQLPHHKLVILSDGPEATALRQRAAGAPNIHFTGMVSETERIRYLAACTATICVAKEEDFGLCAVESLAAGKPVLAAHAGGLAEICADTAYSVLLPADPTAHDTCEAVSICDKQRAEHMRHDCQHRAASFALPRFAESIQAIAHD